MLLLLDDVKETNVELLLDVLLELESEVEELLDVKLTSVELLEVEDDKDVELDVDCTNVELEDVLLDVDELELKLELDVS